MTGSVDLSDLDLESSDTKTEGSEIGGLKAQLEQHFETASVATPEEEIPSEEVEFQPDALPVPITFRPFSVQDANYTQRNGNNCVGVIQLYSKNCHRCTALNRNINPYDKEEVKRKEMLRCWPGHSRYNGAPCPAQYIELVVTGHVDKIIRKHRSAFGEGAPSPNARLMNLQSLVADMEAQNISEHEKAQVLEALGIQIGQ